MYKGEVRSQGGVMTWIMSSDGNTCWRTAGGRHNGLGEAHAGPKAPYSDAAERCPLGEQEQRPGRGRAASARAAGEDRRPARRRFTKTWD